MSEVVLRVVGHAKPSGDGGSRLVSGRRLPTADAVAQAGYRAMLAGKPVAVVGLPNRLLAASVRFTPRPVVRRVVQWMQEPR